MSISRTRDNMRIHNDARLEVGDKVALDENCLIVEPGNRNKAIGYLEGVTITTGEAVTATVRLVKEGDMNYIEKIVELDACRDALGWLRAENHPTLQDAWAACTRPDWKLWLAGRLSGDRESEARRKYVLCLCDIAETRMQGSAGQTALDLARRFGEGEDISRDDLYAAADDAAYAAAEAASYAYTANAAASYTAANAADDAAYAADAANAANDAAAYAKVVAKYYAEAPEL